MLIYVLEGQIEDKELEIWEVIYAGVAEKEWEEFKKENIVALKLTVWDNGKQIEHLGKFYEQDGMVI